MTAESGLSDAAEARESELVRDSEASKSSPSRGDAPDPNTGPNVESVLEGLDSTVVFQLKQPHKPSTQGKTGGTRFAYVSPNIRRIFGIAPEKVLADPATWYAAVEPAALPELLAQQYEAFCTGSRLDMEVPFHIALGSFEGRRTFRLNARREIRPDGTIVWNGVMSDVTRSAGRTRLLDVLEVSPDLVGTVDAAGRIVYLNRSGHDMLGLQWSHDPDQRIAEVGIETLHPPDMQELYWNEIVPTVKRHGVWTGDTEVVDRHGERIPVSQVVVAHRAPGESADRPGPITHLSTIVRDMRTRARMEENLRAARRASETARDAAEMARAHAENTTYEVNHRVKNLFALVPAIVQLSARSTDDVKTLVRMVRERIAALARSHDLTLNENGELTGVSLRDLLETVLQPYQGAAGSVSLEGPTVRLNAADGNALSLVLHELATNAAKHGALSAAGGALDVTWDFKPRDPTVKGPHEDDSRWTVLYLQWRETSRDTPPLPIRAPERVGSGTLLLDRLVGVQNGSVERDWTASGVSVRLQLPIHGARPARRSGAGTPDA